MQYAPRQIIPEFFTLQMIDGFPCNSTRHDETIDKKLFSEDWRFSAVEGRLTAGAQRTTGQISNRNQNSVVLRHCRDVVDAQSWAVEGEEND